MQGNEGPDAKRIIVSQSEFPNSSLELVLRLPRAIWDDLAGKPAAPLRVAMALGVKPSSGGWRNLCGSSIAYGLTEGGYNAAEIGLTPLGLKIVRPTREGEDVTGLREAILRPRIQREFLQRYDGAKFPKDEIARNVLIDLGLPKDRSEAALQILKANARFAQIIADIKGDSYVMLKGTGADAPVPQSLDFRSDDKDFSSSEDTPEQQSPAAGETQQTSSVSTVERVFITHGKNQKILEQLQRVVRLGNFEPVVAKNNETAAKPVPDKVLDDMRSCQAAVIHVGVDGILYDKDENEIPQINQNVLIEIGVARAWYRNKFILLVEEGIALPSNLQGLYECRYSGNDLGMDAAFKILEAFADFRKTT